jgi:hypothetical protein
MNDTSPDMLTLKGSATVSKYALLSLALVIERLESGVTLGRACWENVTLSRVGRQIHLAAHQLVSLCQKRPSSGAQGGMG